MILTLEETKNFLKIDYDDEDTFLLSTIVAAESYLTNATGKKYDSNNELAKIYCLCLINEWFKDRGLMEDDKVTTRVKFTLQSILLQLEYSGGVIDGTV